MEYPNDKDMLSNGICSNCGKTINCQIAHGAWSWLWRTPLILVIAVAGIMWAQQTGLI